MREKFMLNYVLTKLMYKTQVPYKSTFNKYVTPHKNIDIKRYCSGQFYLATTDEDYLKQILLRYLDNFDYISDQKIIKPITDPK